MSFSTRRLNGRRNYSGIQLIFIFSFPRKRESDFAKNIRRDKLMNNMEIKFFDDDLEKFIGDLESPTIAKILRTIDLLEKFGNALGPPHSKKIGPRLFELRVRGKQEVRILYTFHMNAAVLLHGFIKKTDKILKKELEVVYKKIKTLDAA